MTVSINYEDMEQGFKSFTCKDLPSFDSWMVPNIPDFVLEIRLLITLFANKDEVGY